MSVAHLPDSEARRSGCLLERPGDGPFEVGSPIGSRSASPVTNTTPGTTPTDGTMPKHLPGVRQKLKRTLPPAAHCRPTNALVE